MDFNKMDPKLLASGSDDSKGHYLTGHKVIAQNRIS